MSEYQYSEFKAIDKPLIEKDMQALRDLSTRARITSTSFVNEYHWGDFKGDPLKLVERYFDAFLYVANWGTHWFMLRVPRQLVDVDLAGKYCPGESAVIHEKGEYLIFEFTSTTEDYDWEKGEEWLSSLISLRDAIINGDYRVLYLAWLFGAQMEEIEEDELEPPVPPNLADLNAPLQSFADFMRIDEDLIVAAAENSASEARQADPEALKTWIHNLPANEKDEILLRLVEAPSPHLGAELRRRFQKAAATTANSTINKPLRSVQELLARAETIAEERERRAAEQKARQQAKKKRERAIAREKYLKDLAEREDSIWKEVEALIDSKQPAKYDEAVKLLAELQDLNKTSGNENVFNATLQKICEKHRRKPGFLNRLKNKGLTG
jgi:hypothetical protein